MFMASERDMGFLLDSVGDTGEQYVSPKSLHLENDILAFTGASKKPSHIGELKRLRDELSTESRTSKRLSNTVSSYESFRALTETSIPTLQNELYAEEGSKKASESVKDKLAQRSKSSNPSGITANNKKSSPLLFDESGSKDKNVINLTKKQREDQSTYAAKDRKSELRSLDVQNVLKKVIVTPDFEKLKTIPPYELSKRKLQQERKKEREKTKGKNWFGLPATEMADEVKHDLEIIQMRSVLDPKHFYKKNDLTVLPKYFQVGKVMDSPLDYYNNRLTNKERKKTLVDELLADAQFQKYNKRKYNEVLEEKQKIHYKSWRKAKRLKKNKM